MSEQVEHVYGGDVGEDPTLPQDETPHVAVMAGLATAHGGAGQPGADEDSEDAG